VLGHLLLLLPLLLAPLAAAVAAVAVFFCFAGQV